MKDTPFAFTGSAVRRRALFSFLALLALAATSCRTSVLAPEPLTGASFTPQIPGAGTGAKDLDPTMQVPRIIRLHNDVQNGTLVIRGQFVPRLRAPEPFYDPARAGGWMLQVFLNTDQAETGYGSGYDYIVRGGEWDPDLDRVVVRRITLDDSFPGGWGPASGGAFLESRTRSFEVRVPLSSMGGDDGKLEYALETYATVPCPECPGAISQEFVDGYVSATSASGRPIVSRLPVGWDPSGRLVARGMRHTTSVDPLATALRER